MNIQRMNELADFLSYPNFEFISKAGFDLRVVAEDKDSKIKIARLCEVNCNTIACIAGHECILNGDPDQRPSMFQAQKLLDLTDNQSKMLFVNHDNFVSSKSIWSDITRFEAAAAIRRMVAIEISSQNPTEPIK